MTETAVAAPTELPLVSVVVPVLNGEARLGDSLAALFQQDYPRERYEVIVADARSMDGSRELAERFGCRVVDNPGITVAAGRNAGVRAARGTLIAFSEDDIVVPRGWLRAAVCGMEEHLAAGVGGPTPIPEDAGGWSRAVNAVFRLASEKGGAVQSDRVATGEVEDLPGGNAVYRTSALREVGPIDERLTTAEDVDLHRRMRAAGLRLVMLPELQVEHRKRDTVRGFFHQMARFAVGRVQLQRRGPGALGRLHKATGFLGLVLGTGLVALAATDVIFALGVIFAGWAVAMLVALHRGERGAAVHLFPLAMAVFLAGWSWGMWSETLLPSTDPRRPGLWHKLSAAASTTGVRAGTGGWVVLGLFLTTKLGLLAVLAVRAPLVMDEFQQGGFARHIDAGYYSAVTPFKTVLFTYLYYLPRLWLDRASSILVACRGLTLGVVVVTLAVLYAVSRRLGRTRVESSLVVVMTLGFSTFMERSFRLRAEPSALLFATLALLTALPSKQTETRPYRGVLPGLLLGGAFLCTQKAIWFGVSLGLAGAVSEWRRGGTRGALTWLGGLAVGGGSTLVAYCFAFWPASPETVFRGVFLRSARFGLEHERVYQDLGKFLYQTWTRNSWLYAGAVAGFLVAATRLRTNPRAVTAWGMTAMMAGFVLTWKQPWPYVFTWLIPFAGLWFPELIRVLVHRLATGGRSIHGHDVALAVALATALGCSFPRNIETLGFSNARQLEFVDHVESLLSANDTYQDGIGMVSTRARSGSVWWDVHAITRIRAAAARGDYSELEDAVRDDPKVLVMTYRLAAVWDHLAPLVERSHVPVDRGLLVAGHRLSPGVSHNRFRVRWPGRYGVVDADGRPVARPLTLNGKTTESEIFLSTGEHEVSAERCPGCTLIPADLVGRVVPRGSPEAADLFRAPYTR